MAIPLGVTTYDPGVGGIPTTNNPRNLSGWIETYQDSLLNEFGAESCRITGRCASIEEAIDWTERLMSAIEVYTPAGKPRFFGFLHEVSIPALEVSLSLTDMANAVIVRYTDPAGVKGTQTATNSASIAKYGRKELVLNFSTAYAAEATNRAATVLAQLAQPPNKETVTTDPASGPYRVELTFRGWAETLKWLTTSSTTTATAVTSTQVTSLISAYNSTNAFFDTASSSVVSTGFSATQFCDPDTTYFERIATLLAAGNSSQQRVAWGFYTRAITIAAAASATPDTIAYYYSKRKGELRDAYNNIVPEWDWAPDVMIQNTDALHAPPPSGAIATLTRKYIRRVSLSISERGEVKGSLEPDDPDKLPEFLAKPVSVTSGVSARHAQIEARIVRAAKIRTIAADNSLIYNPSTGVLLPGSGGTGVSNTGTIDLGGGSISTGGGSINTGGGSVSNTGGGAVDLGTGSGIGGGGSSGVTTTGGTTGRLAQWSSSSALTAATMLKTGAGVVTVDSASTITLDLDGSSGQVLRHNGTNWIAATLTASDISNLNESIDDRVAALLVAGTNITLTYDDGGNSLTIDAASGAPANATYITQTSNGTLTNEQALASLSTGVMKSTTTTGVVSTMTGTSGRITEWSDGTTIGASTLIKSGAGVLTLSASTTETLTITDGGTLDLGGFTLNLDGSLRVSGASASTGDVLEYDGTAFVPAAPSGLTGTGSSGRFAIWSGASTLTNDTGASFDTSTNIATLGGLNLGAGTIAGTGDIAGSGNFSFQSDGTVEGGFNVGTSSGAPAGSIRASGTMATNQGVTWNWGGYAAGTFAQTGYVSVEINGTSRRLMIG